MRFHNLTTIPADAIEEPQTMPPGSVLVFVMSGTLLFWAGVASYLV